MLHLYAEVVLATGRPFEKALFFFAFGNSNFAAIASYTRVSKHRQHTAGVDISCLSPFFRLTCLEKENKVYRDSVDS